MKTYVVLLRSAEIGWIQYAGQDEEKARDVKSFEDYKSFTDMTSVPGDESVASFVMHVWEDGKGLFTERYDGYDHKWEIIDIPAKGKYCNMF